MYNSSFQGQRRFLTALAIETVLMILNSAHYKRCQRKIKRAACTRHAHAQSSIVRSYLCARAYGAEKEYN